MSNISVTDWIGGYFAHLFNVRQV